MTLRIKKCWCGSLALRGDVITCPCCGYLKIGQAFARVEPQMANVLMRLALARGELVSMGELTKWLYGHRADGGALAADNVIKQQICKLNTVIRELNLNLQIVNQYGRGYRLENAAIIEEAA